MKLTTRATIGGQDVHIVNHDIMLDLSAGGRAIVTVNGQVQKGQLLTLDVGYNNDMRRFFDGYVFDVQPAPGNAQQVLCRERAGVLAARFPVSKLHATLRALLAWLSEQTGLVFMLPPADYVDKPIPNFTSSGSGYQLLDNAGRAFGIPDFVWYQEPSGRIFVGSHADSQWHGRDMPLDPAWSGRQAGNLLVLPVLPAMRPGMSVNGKRVTRVRVKNDDMTLTLVTPGKVVKSPARANIESEFPELADGMHLPKFGRVEAISDSAVAGQRNDPYRPRYAVDVQLLGENGEPDALTPLYRAVPLPVAFGGPEQGLLQYPLEGTIVELGFAFGRADRPFIRTILGTGWPLPDITPGEQLQLQRAEVFNRTDTVGNQVRHTDRTQDDRALQMNHQADEYQGAFGQHHIITLQHSVEEVGAMKRIEALGGIELLAGDDITLGCLGNMSQTTAGDLAEVVGRARRAVAGELQHLEAPRSWVGTDSINTLRLMLELMGVVEQLATLTASHRHGGPPPDNTQDIAAQSAAAGQLSEQLSPIIE